jgi:hypothetical protein
MHPSVAIVPGAPLGHFAHISTTTPVVSTFKNYCILEAPVDILNHFWIQVAVSLLKLRFQKRNGRYETVSEIPQRTQFYPGAEIINWHHPSSTFRDVRVVGPTSGKNHPR